MPQSGQAVAIRTHSAPCACCSVAPLQQGSGALSTCRTSDRDENSIGADRVRHLRLESPTRPEGVNGPPPAKPWCRTAVASDNPIDPASIVSPRTVPSSSSPPFATLVGSSSRVRIRTNPRRTNSFRHVRARRRSPRRTSPNADARRNGWRAIMSSAAPPPAEMSHSATPACARSRSIGRGTWDHGRNCSWDRWEIVGGAHGVSDSQCLIRAMATRPDRQTSHTWSRPAPSSWTPCWLNVPRYGSWPPAENDCAFQARSPIQSRRLRYPEAPKRTGWQCAARWLVHSSVAAAPGSRALATCPLALGPPRPWISPGSSSPMACLGSSMAALQGLFWKAFAMPTARSASKPPCPAGSANALASSTCTRNRGPTWRPRSPEH